MNETTVSKSRVVAIVGRPNVGKSAVFNRIAGKRIAIVHDQSGVTRDRLMREVEWEEQRFNLVDTGGVAIFDAKSERDPIESGIRSQVDSAMGDAAVAILTVDVQQGVHPMDEEVAAIVRKAGIPCVVAVNKCDLPAHEANAEEFASLGFPIYPVAAQHNRGFGDLMDAVLPLLPPAPENETEKNPLRVAVVGRPNAGKSSYINRLLNEDRVIVSDVAGTTRDCIDVPFTIGEGEQARHYTLVDTAGMRNRHRVDSAVERFSLFRSEDSVKQADVVVLVMDPELGPTGQDKHIAGLIQQERKGCVMLMNKWDWAQNQGMDAKDGLQAIRQMMPFMDYCPLLFISAKTGFNVKKSISVIDRVAANTRMTLPTGLLNRTLTEATDRVVAPSRFGKRLKLYYAVQVCASPVTLRIFVNDAKLATDAYTKFLTDALRDRFGLEGAPVVIYYKTRSRPEAVESRQAAYEQFKEENKKKPGFKGGPRRSPGGRGGLPRKKTGRRG